MNIQKSEKKIFHLDRIENISKQWNIRTRKRIRVISQIFHISIRNRRHNYFYRIVIFTTTKLSISRYLEADFEIQSSSQEDT